MVTDSDIIILALTECVCDVVVIAKYAMPIAHIYIPIYYTFILCIDADFIPVLAHIKY